MSTVEPSRPSPSDDAASTPSEVGLALFDFKLAQLQARETAVQGRRNLWLAHHWPADYGDRCVRLGSRHLCRRCAALYPLSFTIAFAAAAGLAPWPAALDPWPIWLLSIPATVAYVGEALGVFRYDIRWQVGTTLVAAIAFGRALGYELLDRWHPWFWGPLSTFGALWFLATLVAHRRRARGHNAAMASTSSSSVL